MPNWTTDEGENLFGFVHCKRCLRKLRCGDDGEVEVHECLDGGLWTSRTIGAEHYVPVPVVWRNDE